MKILGHVYCWCLSNLSRGWLALETKSLLANFCNRGADYRPFPRPKLRPSCPCTQLKPTFILEFFLTQQIYSTENYHLSRILKVINLNLLFGNPWHKFIKNIHGTHPCSSSMALDSPWPSVAFYDTPWHSMAFHDTPWHYTAIIFSVAFHSTPCHSMTLHDTSWYSMALHGTPVHSMALHATPLHLICFYATS